jgi:hypothetical protein
MPVELADRNLQLAMIDEVYRRRSDYYWVAQYRERYEALGPRLAWSELEHNESEHVVELEQLLATLAIEPAELAAITSLTLDGDRDLYAWVYPNWWDFGDHFQIRDLAGLEHCTAIEYLLLGQGVVEGASLRPLARLPTLRELHVCALCGSRDIESILELPALAKLDVINVRSSPDRARWEAVIAELATRGVTIA